MIADIFISGYDSCLLEILYHIFSLLFPLIMNLSFSHGCPRSITDVLLYHELSNYRISFHTDVRGISRMFFFITNYRIIELSSHGVPRMFFFITNYRIIELSSHGVPRNITDVFLYHELSNYRIVFTRSSTENHGILYLVTYKIIIRDIP